MPDANDRKYEWDENKRALNLLYHNLDFREVDYFDWDAATRRRSDRGNEVRHTATGMFRGKLHTVVYTEREGLTRIISFRRANKQEVRRHAESND